jgi:serine phosphatase RsbU (regulator of sigma subunit)
MSQRVKETVLAGVRAAWWVSPVSVLSGDMVECLPTGRDGGAALFVLGDAMGKGRPAYRTVTLVSGALRDLASVEPPEMPGQVLSAMHRRLPGLTPPAASFYMPMCVAIAPPEGRKLAICNAGLPVCVLRQGGGVAHVPAGGYPPGLPLPVPKYDEFVFDVAPGDLVVIASDGVAEFETAAPPGSCYGIDELVRALECACGSASDVLRTLMCAHEEALKRHGASAPDDRSILVLEVL